MTTSWVNSNSDSSKDYWYYDNTNLFSWSYLDYHYGRSLS
jgi:hypothetical protein